MSTITVGSDREVDALVAEHIMGLKVRAIRVIGLGGSILSDVGTVDPPRKLPDGREGVAAHALPGFSTNPEACAKLKAHVRKSHREWIIETTEAAAGVTVAVWATADDLIRGLGATAATQSDTIERATCTVLLRCYGIEVEYKSGGAA
jgi:hypothetical protein